LANYDYRPQSADLEAENRARMFEPAYREYV
jgi:hypothetical protein